MDSEPNTDATPLTDYTPVALAERRNGWTADRQRRFLAGLAETGSISQACLSAGITARSAYRLRADPRGKAFAAAWDQALLVATNTLTVLAYERATRGSYREYWKDGQLVGETRQPSDNLLKWLLSHLAPHRFGKTDPYAHMSGRVAIAQARFPGMIDELTDTDMYAEPLGEADCTAQPRPTAHDPRIAPIDLDESEDDMAFDD
ncbi:hypothetical protein P1X14_19340 [Sphingomonas sp. AOB5]|uniref:hypothetical protein n=1 Tax=Sphingomonas sp. AOB5 TaxID=3034017 RepID=UPI0023F65429|nr:hypothetical protein [Sphingomonas sp. AOB5]MDF7777420.1 hypothetical protein [Sphingomonas sp. AOB5]